MTQLAAAVELCANASASAEEGEARARRGEKSPKGSGGGKRGRFVSNRMK